MYTKIAFLSSFFVGAMIGSFMLAEDFMFQEKGFRTGNINIGEIFAQLTNILRNADQYTIQFAVVVGSLIGVAVVAFYLFRKAQLPPFHTQFGESI
jgi:hypothetical protein